MDKLTRDHKERRGDMELNVGKHSWKVSDDERPSLTAWLTINRACNLRCNWCYAKMTGFNDANMSLDTASKCIGLLKELGLNAIILIGGEPTIHPEFLNIVKEIRNAGMEAYLVTNALRFSDEKFLQKTLDAGVSSITISFKAANREMFLEDTGYDGFDQSVQAVRNIVRSGVNHVVNITACKNLISNFEEMIAAVKSTGTDKFSIDTGKPIFLNGKSCVDGMGTPGEMADFFIRVYPELEKSGLRFSLKVAVPFCLFPRDFVEKLISDGNILTGCQMIGNRGLIFDPEGKLLPCNHVCDFSVGKIGEDFLSGEEYLSFRKREDVSAFYSSMASCPHNKCVECPYWIMCGAGCKLYWLHYGEEEMMGNFPERR